MSKEVTITAETSLENLQKTLEELIYSDKVKYDETDKSYLIDICNKNIRGYYKDIIGDLKYLRNSIAISTVMKQLPDFIIDRENQSEVIKLYNQGVSVMTFEKEQMTRLKEHVKQAKKMEQYENAPLVYCVFLGLVQSHINTNSYIATRKEMIYNDNRNIHFSPVKKYELPSDEYQETITLAIDKLYGKEIPKRDIKKVKCK